MATTGDKIDPELRHAARIARLIFPPSIWSFRLINFILDFQKGNHPRDLDVEEIAITRSDENSTIRTCIYKPKDAPTNLPILLYIHGGGYAMGSPEMSVLLIKQFIKAKPCVVVAPTYRRSFDAPYPAAIDDCYDTLLWVKSNTDSLGGRDDQIFVAGHSAGGGLTAAVSLRARDRGDVNIAFQMPIYPMIDDRMMTPSAIDNTAPIWDTKKNKIAWNLYLRRLKNNDTPIPYDAAPARATDYSGLPPTATFIGTLDPFLDETRSYVENLRLANIPVTYEEFTGGFHAFEMQAPKAKISQRAHQFLSDSFCRAVDTCFATQAP